MLHIERNRKCSIRLTPQERFLNSTFLAALAIAIALHAMGALLLKVDFIGLRKPKKIMPYVSVFAPPIEGNTSAISERSVSKTDHDRPKRGKWQPRDILPNIAPPPQTSFVTQFALHDPGPVPIEKAFSQTVARLQGPLLERYTGPTTFLLPARIREPVSATYEILFSERRGQPIWYEKFAEPLPLEAQKMMEEIRKKIEFSIQGEIRGRIFKTEVEILLSYD